jgi:hypothetical protein
MLHSTQQCFLRYFFRANKQVVSGECMQNACALAFEFSIIVSDFNKELIVYFFFNFPVLKCIIIIIINLFLTTICLTPGGSSTVHIYSTQSTENGTHVTIKKLTNLGNEDRAPSLRVMPLRFPYN